MKDIPIVEEVMVTITVTFVKIYWPFVIPEATVMKNFLFMVLNIKKKLAVLFVYFFLFYSLKIWPGSPVD